MLDVEPKTRADASRSKSELRALANGLPTVSVVSVASYDVDATVRKITACFGHWLQFGVELIVVCTDRDGSVHHVLSSTGVRLIHAPVTTSESELRSLGLAAAQGDLVMLVDDPATANDNWISHLRGGAVTEALGALA